MLKYLRIAVTALSLIACVLLIALWVRSYWWMDNVWGPVTETKRLVTGSITGWLQFRLDDRKSEAHWHLKSDSVQALFAEIRAVNKGARFQPIWETARFGMNGDTFFIPYWFPVFLFAALAMALWLPWLKRFSLRTLFIATTLVAVGLAAIAVSS